MFVLIKNIASVDVLYSLKCHRIFKFFKLNFTY